MRQIRHRASRPRRTFERLEQRTLLAAFIWNTDADGNWNDEANWSGSSGIPGPGDTVTIDRGLANPTITIQGDARVDLLTSAETLVVNSNLTANKLSVTGGELRWQAGRISSSDLTISENATFNIQTIAPAVFIGTINNAGAVNQRIALETPARDTRFANLATAIWTVEDNFRNDSGFSIEFTNAGTFRKVGVGESTFPSANDQFNHIAGSVIEVDQGTLYLPQSGAQSKPSTGAEFRVADGAVLNLNTGTSYFVGTYRGTGNGRVELSRGTIDVRDFKGGSGTVFDFEPGLFHWIGGTIRTDGAGGDPMINTGDMIWSGTGDRILVGQEFRNRGTITQLDDGKSLFNTNGLGTWFHNETGGLFEHYGSGGVLGGRIYNDSVIRNVAGDTEFRTVLYANTGSRFEVTDGRVTLTNGGEFGSTELVVADSGVIEFDGTTGGNFQLTLGATVTGTGDGLIEFSNGSIESVGGDGVIDFADGLFHWTGGNFFRDITNAGHIAISGSAPKRILNGFTNRGSVVQEPGTHVNLSSIGVTNTVGAEWEMQGDASFGGAAFVTARFHNAGTLRKTGSGTASIEADGVALSHQGGTLDLQQGTLVANHSTNAVGSGGHFIVADGSRFEILGTLASSGKYTGQGEGDVIAKAKLTGADLDFTLDFPAGFFEWATPGLAQNSGRITNDGHITLNNSEATHFISTLINNGTIVQTSGSHVQLRNFSSTINHGIWELQGDANIELVEFSSLAASLTNFGTIRKTGGGTTSIFSKGGSRQAFNNPGLVQVADGSIEIAAQYVKQLDRFNDVLHGGTWYVGPASTLKFVEPDGTESEITQSNAMVILDGEDSIFASLTDLQTNGGVLDIRGGRDFVTTGNLTNGVDRTDTPLTSLLGAFSGRLVGIAIDPSSGDLITHARNERVDGEPIFRRFASDGSLIPPAITQPGGPVAYSGLDITTKTLNVGGTTVPVGTMLFVHANATPATLYAIDPSSGDVLASVELENVPVNQSGIAYHPGRGTVYLLGLDNNIREIDSSDGSLLQTLPVRPTGSASFSGSYGGIDVVAESGDLLIVGSQQRRVRVMTATGSFVGDVDLTYAGLVTTTFSDISYDDTNDAAWISTEEGQFYRFDFSGVQTHGELRLGSGSELTVSKDFVSSGGTVSIELLGRPETNDFGKLTVSGNAALSGTLSVREARGFSGLEGDNYQVVAFAQRDDSLFDTIKLPIDYDSGYAANSFVVSVGDLRSPDLVVTNVTGPELVSANETVTLTWTVTNQGNANAVGPWHDELLITRRSTIVDPLSLFLFGDEIRAEDAASIRQIQVGQGLTLEPGQSVTFEAEVRVPGRETGSYWWRVDTNTRVEVLEITNDPANNTGYTDGPFELDVSELIVGADWIDGTFTSIGDELWYRFEVPASQDVLLELDATNGEAVTELFAGAKFQPSRFQFTTRHRQLNTADTSLTATGGAATTTWYLLARLQSSDVALEPFRIRASAVPATLGSVSPRAIGNTGENTLKITGTQLHDSLLYRLVSTDGVQTATATKIVRSSATVAYASFDTSTLSVGEYKLEVVDGDNVVDSIADAVTVEEARPAKVQVSLTVPSIVRAGRQTPITLNFRNPGNVDMRVPFTTITAELGNLRVRRDGTYNNDALTIIPPGPTPGLTVLPPGASSQIVLYYTAPIATTIVDINVHTMTVDDPQFANSPIDWGKISDNFRPQDVEDAAWEGFINTNRQQFGDTFGELFAYISTEFEMLADRGYENIFYYEGFMNFELPRIVTDQSVVRVAAGGNTQSASDLFQQSVVFVGPQRVEGESTSAGAQEVHAVVIGGGEGLPGTARDARAVADYLNTGLNQIPQVLTAFDDDDDGPVTSTEVLGILATAAADTDENDVLFVYNASHGTCNFSPGVEDRQPAFSYQTGDNLSPAQINEAIGTAKGKIVFVADTCFSGEVTAGINADIKIASAGPRQVTDDVTFGQHLIKELAKNPASFDIIKASQVAAAEYRNSHLYGISSEYGKNPQDFRFSSKGPEASEFIFKDLHKESFDRPIGPDNLPVKSMLDLYDFYVSDPSVDQATRDNRKQQLTVRRRGMMDSIPVFDRGGFTSFELPVTRVKGGDGGQDEDGEDNSKPEEKGITSEIETASRNQRPNTRGRIDVRQSFDPNEKIGPAGFGAEGFIVGDSTMPFTILFENDPKRATLPAQTVTITEILDEDLDLQSFELGSIQVGQRTIVVPSGLYAYHTTVNLVPAGIEMAVEVNAELNFSTRTVTWSFTSIDLDSGQPTTDALAGFLLVNDETRRGEGSVSYSIRPLTSVATGTEISGPAKIVFDVNDPLITNSTLNTIDLDAPSSQVKPLSPESPPSFIVTWSGDDGSGAGISTYDILVSENDGPNEVWLENTTLSSSVFSGTVGSTYSFFSVSTDHVGRIESSASPIGTETVVSTKLWTNAVNIYDVNLLHGVTALDALIIINELSFRRFSDKATSVLDAILPPGIHPPYFDVTMDGRVTALDALRVINELPRVHNTAAEPLNPTVQSMSFGMTTEPTSTMQQELVDWLDPTPKIDPPMIVSSFAYPNPNPNLLELKLDVSKEDEFEKVIDKLAEDRIRLGEAFEHLSENRW